MFGIWLLSSAVANALAGITGSYIDAISAEIGLNGFFCHFCFSTYRRRINNVFIKWHKIKRMMHGIK